MLLTRRMVPLLIVGQLSCGGDAATPLGNGPPLTASQVVSTDASVRFSAIEGGCWALETPDGTYEPINLPSEYRVDGLQVRVVLRGAPNYYSICMMAPLVSIDTIGRR